MGGGRDSKHRPSTQYPSSSLYMDMHTQTQTRMMSNKAEAVQVHITVRAWHINGAAARRRLSTPKDGISGAYSAVAIAVDRRQR